jgi:hypothetical protein
MRFAFGSDDSPFDERISYRGALRADRGEGCINYSIIHTSCRKITYDHLAHEGAMSQGHVFTNYSTKGDGVVGARFNFKSSAFRVSNGSGKRLRRSSFGEFIPFGGAVSRIFLFDFRPSKFDCIVISDEVN